MTREKLRWRVGRKLGRTVYYYDQLQGIMDTPDMAQFVIDACNAWAERDAPEASDKGDCGCSAVDKLGGNCMHINPSKRIMDPSVPVGDRDHAATVESTANVVGAPENESSSGPLAAERGVCACGGTGIHPDDLGALKRVIRNIECGGQIVMGPGGEPFKPCPECKGGQRACRPAPGAVTLTIRDAIVTLMNACRYYGAAVQDDRRQFLERAIAEAAAAEREAERKRIEAAWDKDRMKFYGHDHWDHTMQHGAGCYRCKDIRAAMDAIDAAIRARKER